METRQHSPSHDEIAAVLLADDAELGAATSPDVLCAELGARREHARPQSTEPPQERPQTPTTCLERGSRLAHLGRHKEAIADCNRVLQLRAKVIEAHLLRGDIFLSLERHAQAASDFTAALAIDPANSAAYHGRGQAQVETGQLEAALADFTEAIRLDPGHAPAYANRGLLLQRTDEPEPALKDLAKAFLLDRSYALAYCHQLRLVHLARAQDDLAAAAQALADLLAPMPCEAPVRVEDGSQPAKAQTGVRKGTRLGSETLVRPPAPTLLSEARAHQVKTSAHPHQPVGHKTGSAKLRGTGEESNHESSELAEYQREQALLRKKEQEREQEIQHARQRLQAETARSREEERRRQQPKRRVRKAGNEADEDDARLPRWKKGMLVAGMLLAFWWLGSHAWGWLKDHQARAPLTAAKVCKDFEADPAAARHKYGGNTFEVSGKVKVVNGPNGPRVLFHTPETTQCSIECIFPSKEMLKDIRTDQELTIEGECSLRPERGRTLIVLAECVVRSGL